MELTLHPPVNQPWLKDDGTPNANGRLTFFAPGTTTPKDVHFKDDNAERGNVIELNQFGLPVGGVIYFKGRYDISMEQVVDDELVELDYIDNFGETEFKDGEDGAVGPRGIPGKDLVATDPTFPPGIEFVFAITAEDEAPSLPDNDWEFDEPMAPWEDGAPSASPTLPYLWQSIRRQVGGVWQHWSAPAKVSKYGIDGVDGDSATDGEGFEAIFISTATTELPSEPNNNWEFDNPQDPWHDVNSGISQALPYEWTSTRRKVNGAWQAWSPARIIAQFSASETAGVDGTDGVDGVDGFGVEFIYTTTTTDVAPTDPVRAWSFDMPQLPWHDEPQAISAVNVYLWLSTRQTKAQAPRTGADGDWSSPIIINRWVADGRDGEDAVGEAGQNGNDGTDGVGLEFVYAVTNNDTIAEASLPSNSWGYSSPGGAQGLEWSNNIPTLTSALTRIFSSQRSVVGVPEVGSLVSDEWSTPAIIGSWGVNGTHGNDGADGASGADGQDLSAPERIVLFDALMRVSSVEAEIEFTTQAPDREGTVLISGWGGAFQSRFDHKAALAATGVFVSTATSALANSGTAADHDNFNFSAAEALSDSAFGGRTLELSSFTVEGFTAKVSTGVLSPPPVSIEANQDGNDIREKLTITFIPD